MFVLWYFMSTLSIFATSSRFCKAATYTKSTENLLSWSSEKKITENSGFTDSIHVMVAICEVYGTILINSLVATVYLIRKIM